MKRTLSIISIAVILGALLQLGNLFTASPPPRILAAVPFANFPQDTPQTVTFDADEATLGRMTQREQTDQFRDWLLLSVLADAGLSVEQVNQSTFDLAPIRHDVLTSVTNFEYGETRSRLLEGGRVIALVPHDQQPKARSDALAHIADRHRKNAGMMPNEMIVFEYTLDLNGRTGTLTRRQPLAANAVFSETYGYHTAIITSRADLEQFLSTVDDLTSARIVGGKLEVSGRRIAGYDYRGIGVEEIAALWQSEHKLIPLYEEEQRLNTEYQACVDQAMASGTERVLAEASCTDQFKEQQHKLEEEFAKAGALDGLGFSLDGRYDYAGLAAAFGDLAPGLRKLAAGDGSLTIGDLSKAVNAVAERDPKLGAGLADWQKNLDDLAVLNAFLSQIVSGTLTIEAVQQALPWLDQKVPTLAETYRLLLDEIERQSKLPRAMPRDQIFANMQAALARDPEVGAFFAEAQATIKRGIDELTKTKVTITDQEIQQVSDGLANRDIRPLLQLSKRLAESVEIQSEADGEAAAADILFGELLEVTKDAYHYQAARYDGDLQGTQVGMVLFYTDLLAKLWALDFQNSAPDTAIPDFTPEPDQDLPAFYKAEFDRLPYGRLWFEERDEGFQRVVGNDGPALLFERNATRLLSKSSDPLTRQVDATGADGQGDQSDEAAANPLIGAFIGWWDRHFEEVARYEPEYERLNQIMKWSLVIGWLHTSDTDNRLAFLGDVPVTRDLWFPDWVRGNQQLRFQDWDAIEFYPRGYKGETTEAMELVTSRAFVWDGEEIGIEGGVTLGGRQALLRGSNIADDIGPMLRRSYLKYDAPDLPAHTLRSMDDVAFEFRKVADNQASVVSKAPSAARFRSHIGDVVNAPVEHTTIGQGTTLRFRTRIGDTHLGDLDVVGSRNGFVVGWRGRDLDAGQAVALRLARSPEAQAALRADPAVQSFLQLPEEGMYLVKLKDAERWMKVVPERTPQGTIAPGFQARVGTAMPEHPTYQLAWIDNADFASAVGQNRFLLFQADDVVRHAPAASISTSGPPVGARAVELTYNGVTVRGFLDTSSGMLYLATDEVGKALGMVTGALNNSDLIALKQIATSSEQARYTLPGPRGYTSELLADLDAPPQQIAAKISDDPIRFAKRLADDLDGGLRVADDLLTQGDDLGALQMLKQLEWVHGPSPGIRLRQGMIEIGRGQLTRSARLLDDLPSQPLNERGRFFDEINRRLQLLGPDDPLRQNYRRMAAYADWRDQLIAKGQAPDRIALGVAGDGLDLRLRMDELPKSTIPSAGSSAVPFVYVEDSAGLNNLNWNISPQQTLQQVISGNLGEVVALPADDIAHFNPTTIYVGKQQVTTLKLRGRPIWPAGYQPYTGEHCQTEQAGCQGQAMVYVVYARP